MMEQLKLKFMEDILAEEDLRRSKQGLFNFFIYGGIVLSSFTGAYSSGEYFSNQIAGSLEPLTEMVEFYKKLP